MTPVTTYRVGLWQPVYRKCAEKWSLVDAARCCRCGHLHKGRIPPLECPECEKGDLLVTGRVDEGAKVK